MTGDSSPPARLWSRDFVLAFSANTFSMMVFYLLLTSMALYAAERFQASDSAAGLASSAYIIGSVLARLFSGRLLDVVGRKRMLLVSLAAFVAFSLLYVLADTLPVLIGLRFLHGVAFGAGNTALGASVQAIIPPARRSEGTGYYGLSATLATAIGPFLAVSLSGSGNYEAIFHASSAFSAAAFAIALLLRLPEPPRHAGQPGARKRGFLASLVEPAVLPVTAVILLAGVGYSGVVAFLASYTSSQGMANLASWFFLIYAVAVAVARLFMGRIQDRRGDNIVIYPALAAFAVGVGLLAFQLAPATVAAAAVLAGFGYSTLMSGLQAIAISRVPPAHIGTAVSTFYLVLDVGAGLGPVLLGALVPAAGFQGMYAACSVLAVAAIGVYHLAHGRHQGPAVRRAGPANP
ncbi:MFS transporter [Arthrobacter ginkgonis]|uniref:MFS transporter n=1 Tax=Arthrobacter ginkgonis TaxID=1630594 RepID=A0ABP7BPB4_9MICC